MEKSTIIISPMISPTDAPIVLLLSWLLLFGVAAAAIPSLGVRNLGSSHVQGSSYRVDQNGVCLELADLAIRSNFGYSDQ